MTLLPVQQPLNNMTGLMRFIFFLCKTSSNEFQCCFHGLQQGENSGTHICGGGSVTTLDSNKSLKSHPLLPECPLPKVWHLDQELIPPGLEESSCLLRVESSLCLARGACGPSINM